MADLLRLDAAFETAARAEWARGAPADPSREVLGWRPWEDQSDAWQTMQVNSVKPCVTAAVPVLLNELADWLSGELETGSFVHTAEVLGRVRDLATRMDPAHV